LYKSVRCVCLFLFYEHVLYFLCMAVFENVVLFRCLDGPKEDKLLTNWVTICK